jgi:geranylgeranyl pyrophosphate synthase
MAMKSLTDRADRKKLWDIIKSKPQDDREVDQAIALINKVDGINESEKHSKAMVEDAWRVLDSTIDESFHKLMLRYNHSHPFPVLLS